MVLPLFLESRPGRPLIQAVHQPYAPPAVPPRRACSWIGGPTGDREERPKIREFGLVSAVTPLISVAITYSQH